MSDLTPEQEMQTYEYPRPYVPVDRGNSWRKICCFFGFHERLKIGEIESPVCRWCGKHLNYPSGPSAGGHRRKGFGAVGIHIGHGGHC